jgi:hypothetical protein
MTINVIPKNGTVNGRELKYFIKEFWEDLCPLSKTSSPAWQNNGSKDASFNSGKDLFRLCFSRNPQTTLTRNIHVPQGKGLFIPIMSVVVSLCEKPGADIIEIAKNDQVSITSSSLSLTLDYASLPNLNSYRFNPEEITEEKEEFKVRFPTAASDAIFTIVSSGPCDAAIAGRYVWTGPLSPGAHTVSWKGELHCVGQDCIDIDYTEDITYKITVP